MPNLEIHIKLILREYLSIFVNHIYLAGPRMKLCAIIHNHIMK